MERERHSERKMRHTPRDAPPARPTLSTHAAMLSTTMSLASVRTVDGLQTHKPHKTHALGPQVVRTASKSLTASTKTSRAARRTSATSPRRPRTAPQRRIRLQTHQRPGGGRAGKPAFLWCGARGRPSPAKHLRVCPSSTEINVSPALCIDESLVM